MVTSDLAGERRAKGLSNRRALKAMTAAQYLSKPCGAGAVQAGKDRGNPAAGASAPLARSSGRRRLVLSSRLGQMGDCMARGWFVRRHSRFRNGNYIGSFARIPGCLSPFTGP